MMRVVIRFIFLIIGGCVLNSCVSGPYTSEGQVKQVRSYYKSQKSDNYIIHEQGEWKQAGKNNVWRREQVWLNIDNCCWTTITYAVLDDPEKSYEVQKNTGWELIYIGPWHYVEKLDKKIRLIGKQGVKYGGIRYLYESLDDQNKHIKAMPLRLIHDHTQDKRALAAIKWHDKYGYNKIVDLRRNSSWKILFGGPSYVGSGDLIDSKE